MANQEALKQREAELRLIVEGARDYAIIVTDRERRITSWSAGAENVFGWTAAEAGDETIDIIFTPEDRADGIPEREIETAAADGYAADERWHQRKDGSRAFMNGSVHPLPHDEHGREQGFIKIARDETDRREAEERLRELNETLEARVAERTAELEAAHEQLRQVQKLEAMGSLTGGVAHDFNNLLTPIVGALDMLQRRGLGGEREQRLIAGAAQSAERARTLVQRLLAFARRQPLQAVAVSLCELVRNMADLVSSTTGPQIKVVVEVDDDLPPAKADPNQLEMALLNLSVNARDAMPNGGTLRISATARTMRAGERAGLTAGRYVCLSVADTGSGMDEATLARAVEPFFSTKGVGKGTGLGLSMVHGLASQLGGALTIRSTPGLGTNVELWLPEAEPSPEAPSAKAELAPMRGRGRVLLVDDEELVRLSTADMLGDLGYEVIEAHSAEAALGALNEAKVDLVVTDHLMPGMTGTDFALTVRERSPTLPVLIVSGYAEIEGLDPSLPRLTKPFRKDELAASVAALSQPE